MKILAILSFATFHLLLNALGIIVLWDTLRISDTNPDPYKAHRPLSYKDWLWKEYDWCFGTTQVSLATVQLA
jgi:hypothetical protein